MSPLTFDQMVALAALAVSVLVAASGAWGRSKGDAQADQAIRDKLDIIDDTGKDTRADVREINRKLDEDRRQIASISSRMDSFETRLARVEDRCDARMEGTD